MNKMNKIIQTSLLSTSLVLFIACGNNSKSDNVISEANYFAVANKGAGGKVVIFDTKTQQAMKEISFGTNGSPTYVTYSKKRNTLYVSEETNASIVALNVNDGFSKSKIYDLNATGAFHNWVNDTANQIWVTNPGSKSTSVVSLDSDLVTKLDLNSTGIVTLNADINKSSTTHDTIISNNGKYAYVSVLSGINKDWVIQYKTSDFTIMNAIGLVGRDPHFIVKNDSLFVLTQSDGLVQEYLENNLSKLGKSTIIANAHGVTVDEMYNNIFVSSIVGQRAVSKFNLDDTTVLTKSTTNQVAKAHNVAYDSINKILAVTMSGSTTVEFFDANGSMKSLGEVESGTALTTPFGITYINK